MQPQQQDTQKPLEKFGQDLTALAREGKLDPVIGRDEEIRRTMQILSRRTKNNPVLIGEPGVGKTAIVEALAQRIIKNDVPDSLKHKRLINLEISSLLAGHHSAVNLRNDLKESLAKSKRRQAKLFYLSTKFIRWLAQVVARVVWTLEIS